MKMIILHIINELFIVYDGKEWLLVKIEKLEDMKKYTTLNNIEKLLDIVSTDKYIKIKNKKVIETLEEVLTLDKSELKEAVQNGHLIELLIVVLFTETEKEGLCDGKNN